QAAARAARRHPHGRGARPHDRRRSRLAARDRRAHRAALGGLTMDPFARRRLGRTEVMLPALGFGAAPLGNLFTAIDEEQAAATVTAAWQAGIRYYDTSPWY